METVQHHYVITLDDARLIADVLSELDGQGPAMAERIESAHQVLIRALGADACYIYLAEPEAA